MTEKSNAGLTWEHRLALRLPRPLLFGAFLVAVCLGAAYLIFQWFLDLHVERGAFGIGLFLVFVLMVPAYFFGPFDRQHYEREIQAFYIPGNLIRASRLAGAAGILAFAGMWELLQVLQGHTLFSPWFRLHDGTAATALFVLLGWISGRFGYFIFVGIWHKPGPQRSDTDLLVVAHFESSGHPHA